MNYPDIITEHFFNPKNAGVLLSTDRSVVKAQIGSYAAGDVIELFLLIDQNKVTDAKFKAYGNPYLIAGMSLATEMLIGKTIDQAKKISYQDFVKILSLPPIKLYCALLIEDVIKHALIDK